jgi:phage terminase Nu1 subunit (DNA packaging protein)
LVKTGPGVYDGDRTIRRVLDWYEDERRNYFDTGPSNTSDALNTTRERHAAAAAQRKINEIKLARLQGTNFDMTDIREMWSAILVAVRQMVLAIPARAAAELPHLTRHDLAVMERECGEILRMNSLANPDHGPLPEPKEARA